MAKVWLTELAPDLLVVDREGQEWVLAVVPLLNVRNMEISLTFQNVETEQLWNMSFNKLHQLMLQEILEWVPN